MSDVKSHSRDRFNQYAQSYVNSPSHQNIPELDRLFEIAAPQPDWLVLDVATGAGHTALRFAPHVRRVIASDIAQNMLDTAAAYITENGVTNVEFQLADAENLPFPDGMFDLVTCRIAPHHFPDAATFVRECARVLRSDGVLLVQDQVSSDDRAIDAAANDFERLRDPSHYHAYGFEEWLNMFTDAGFTVVYTEQWVKRHRLVYWAEQQGCTPDVIAELQRRLATVDDTMAAWMLPEGINTPDASFVNRHLVIKGIKA